MSVESRAKAAWTEKQLEVLEGLRKLAELEMAQAYELCQVQDRFVVAKTYHYVFKKGMNRDIPKEFRAIQESPNVDKEIWTADFTEEAIRIAQAGIRRKMDYVRENFFLRFGDDIEGYGFKGCTGPAAILIACGFIFGV